MQATEVPKSQTAPLDKQSFAIKAMATRTLAAQFWFGLWILTSIGLLAMHYLSITELKKRDRVIILDSSGTFYVSPTMPFEKATELHNTQALLATYALYMKNPLGFDMEEQLRKIFNTSTLAQAKAEWKAEEASFQAKQTHQKVEVFAFNILQTQNDLVIVNVKGQLSRTSFFQGRTVVEPLDLDLTLTMMRNPRLGVNDRYPLVVVAYVAKIKPTTAPIPEAE